MTYDEYAAAWAALLAAGDQELLRREYIALIGYDPFEDDPSMTVDEVREIIADYKHDVALYGGVTDGGFGPYVPDLAQSYSDFVEG